MKCDADLLAKMASDLKLAGRAERTVEAYTGATLEVPQIDSDRMQLHIHGKAGRDRYVPLPEGALLMLRVFWRTHRAPISLFPAVTRKGAGGLAQEGSYPHAPATRREGMPGTKR